MFQNGKIRTTRNMLKILGIEFAPLWIKPERRLQTAVVLCWCLCLLFLGFGSTLLTVYLLFYSSVWYLMAIYMIWYYYDRNCQYQGGRRVDSVRRWKIWRYFKNYFPVSLVKTCELNPNKRYIFGYHPHGILAVGGFCNFGTESTGFSELFPGIRPYLLTLDGHFRFPLYKELFMCSGKVPLNLQLIIYILMLKLFCMFVQ